MVIQKQVMFLLWAVIAACEGMNAQQPGEQSPIRPADVNVVDFAELQYPAAAQSMPSEAQGIVVVQAKLDKKGRVVDASALSGQEILVPDTLANIKKWRFQPNAAKAVVMVYNFRVAPGKCKSVSSFFEFERPNLATIIACWPQSAAPSAPASVSPLAEGTISDKEMEVLNFEDLKYPPLSRVARISGIVVARATLNQNGDVVETSAVYGHPILVPSSLDNLKKWKFRPNAKGAAVVVYRFRFSCEGIAAVSTEPSQFILEVPNFATITGTLPLIETIQ